MDYSEAAGAAGFSFGPPGLGSSRQPRPALVHRKQSGFSVPIPTPVCQLFSSTSGSIEYSSPLLLPNSPVQLGQRAGTGPNSSGYGYGQGRSALSHLMLQLSTPPMSMPLASPAADGLSLANAMQPDPSSPSEFFNFSTAADNEVGKKRHGHAADLPDYFSSRTGSIMLDANVRSAAAADPESHLGLSSVESTSSFAASSVDSLTFAGSTSSSSPAPSSPSSTFGPSTASHPFAHDKHAASAASSSEAREEPEARQFLNREELLSLSPYQTSILHEIHAEARRRAMEMERAEQEQGDGNQTRSELNKEDPADHDAPSARNQQPCAAVEPTTSSTSLVDSAFSAMMLVSPQTGDPEHFDGLAAPPGTFCPAFRPQSQDSARALDRDTSAAVPASTVYHSQSSTLRRLQPRPQLKEEDCNMGLLCPQAERPFLALSIPGVAHSSAPTIKQERHQIRLRARGRAGRRPAPINPAIDNSVAAGAARPVESADEPTVAGLADNVTDRSETSELSSGAPPNTGPAPQADFYKATSGSASQRAKQLGTFPGDEAFATSLEELTASRVDRNAKPAYLWWSLIRAAILGSPEGRLQMETLCATISEHFPYFGRAKEAKNWKSSIRSVIHTKPCFHKTEDSATGAVWWHVDIAIDPREQRRGLKKRSSVSSGGDEAEGSGEARKRARTAVQEAMAGTGAASRGEVEEAEASASETEGGSERRLTLRGAGPGEEGQRKKRRRTQ